VKGEPDRGNEDESSKERLQREHHELLEELRTMIPGAEVLFGFLLAIRFTPDFNHLSGSQRGAYYATLLMTALALVLFMAPPAFHRLRFRDDDKETMLRKGNREAIIGSVAIALALTGVIYLVSDLMFGVTQAIVTAAIFFAFTAWRWWLIALVRMFQEARAHR